MAVKSIKDTAVNITAITTMQLIQVKILPPTNTLGKRLKAISTSGLNIMQCLSSKDDDNLDVTAYFLAKKLVEEKLHGASKISGYGKTKEGDYIFTLRSRKYDDDIYNLIKEQ